LDMYGLSSHYLVK